MVSHLFVFVVSVVCTAHTCSVCTCTTCVHISTVPSNKVCVHVCALNEHPCLILIFSVHGSHVLCQTD